MTALRRASEAPGAASFFPRLHEVISTPKGIYLVLDKIKWRELYQASTAGRVRYAPACDSRTLCRAPSKVTWRVGWMS